MGRMSHTTQFRFHARGLILTEADGLRLHFDIYDGGRDWHGTYLYSTAGKKFGGGMRSHGIQYDDQKGTPVTLRGPARADGFAGKAQLTSKRSEGGHEFFLRIGWIELRFWLPIRFDMADRSEMGVVESLGTFSDAQTRQQLRHLYD